MTHEEKKLLVLLSAYADRFSVSRMSENFFGIDLYEHKFLELNLVIAHKKMHNTLKPSYHWVLCACVQCGLTTNSVYSIHMFSVEIVHHLYSVHLYSVYSVWSDQCRVYMCPLVSVAPSLSTPHDQSQRGSPARWFCFFSYVFRFSTRVHQDFIMVFID